MLAGDDDSVRIWDPDTGACLLMIRRRKAVNMLAGYGSRFAIGDIEGCRLSDSKVTPMSRMRVSSPCSLAWSATSTVRVVEASLFRTML